MNSSDSDSEVEFVTSIRGKRKLCDRGFMYYRSNDYANNKIKWRCKNYQKCKCTATIMTTGSKYYFLKPYFWGTYW